jgi:hypothetical protein
MLIPRMRKQVVVAMEHSSFTSDPYGHCLVTAALVTTCPFGDYWFWILFLFFFYVNLSTSSIDSIRRDANDHLSISIFRSTCNTGDSVPHVRRKGSHRR